MSAELPHKPLITSCRLSSSETSSELVSEEERRQDVIRGLCIQAQSARDCALEKLEATEAERSACKAEIAHLQVGNHVLGTPPPTASIHLDHCTSSC